VFAEALTDWTCLGVRDVGFFMPFAAMLPTLAEVFSFLAMFKFPFTEGVD
jgi:hypothetical protein